MNDQPNPRWGVVASLVSDLPWPAKIFVLFGTGLMPLPIFSLPIWLEKYKTMAIASAFVLLAIGVFYAIAFRARNDSMPKAAPKRHSRIAVVGPMSSSFGLEAGNLILVPLVDYKDIRNIDPVLRMASALVVGLDDSDGGILQHQGSAWILLFRERYPNMRIIGVSSRFRSNQTHDLPIIPESELKTYLTGAGLL